MTSCDCHVTFVSAVGSGLSGGIIAAIVIVIIIILLILVAIAVVVCILCERWRYSAELGPPPSRKGSMRLVSGCGVKYVNGCGHEICKWAWHVSLRDVPLEWRGIITIFCVEVNEIIPLVTCAWIGGGGGTDPFSRERPYIFMGAAKCVCCFVVVYSFCLF